MRGRHFHLLGWSGIVGKMDDHRSTPTDQSWLPARSAPDCSGDCKSHLGCRCQIHRQASLTRGQRRMPGSWICLLDTAIGEMIGRLVSTSGFQCCSAFKVLAGDGETRRMPMTICRTLRSMDPALSDDTRRQFVPVELQQPGRANHLCAIAFATLRRVTDAWLKARHHKWYLLARQYTIQLDRCGQD